MSSRVSPQVREAISPITKAAYKVVSEKDYEKFVALLKALGQKHGRIQYQVLEVVEEKAIYNKVFAYGEDDDKYAIIMRDLVDRVDRFGKNAFPLRDWEVEFVARHFIGWSV